VSGCVMSFAAAYLLLGIFRDLIVISEDAPGFGGLVGRASGQGRERVDCRWVWEERLARLRVWDR
jgi:hypothetical protein